MLIKNNMQYQLFSISREDGNIKKSKKNFNWLIDQKMLVQRILPLKY